MQRGGSPTCRDRVMGTVLGEKAVELLEKGESNRIVCWKDGKFVDYSIEEAFNMKKELPVELTNIPSSMKRYVC